MHWCDINSKVVNLLIPHEKYKVKDASGYVHICKYTEGHMLNYVTAKPVDHLISIWL